MTLLAHWPLDEGTHSPATAVDAAAGGSGSHDGTYVHYFVSPGSLFSGGVGGTHLYNRRNSIYGVVDSILNPADLRLTGTMTVMCWYHPDLFFVFASVYLANCSGVSDVEAENDLWDLRIGSNNTLILNWENGAGTDIQTQSGNDMVPLSGWCHLAAARYEVVAGKWGTKFYLNGQLHSTDDNTGAGYDPPTGGGNSLTFINKKGTTQSGNNFWIDSVRVYDTEESQANIEAVYDAELPYKAPSIVEIPTTRQDLVGSDRDSFLAIESGPNSLREFTGFYK